MQVERRPEIQWLRGLAATEVVICHSDLVTKHFSSYQLDGTWWHSMFAGIGVEIFFMVSGYVICMRAQTYQSGKDFFLSRVRRIYPLYAIFTTLVVLTFVLNPAWRLNNFEMSPVSLLQSYLILPQWGFPILGVGWTLEHEMVFYTLVALLLLFRPLHGTAKYSVAWLLAALGFLGCLHSPDTQSSLWLFHIVSPYMLAFGFGWLLRCAEEMSPRGRVLSIAAFLAIAVAGLLIGTDYGERLVFRILVGAGIFALFLAARGQFETDSPVNRFGWQFGDASFSIYLVHWFVLSAFGKIVGIAGLDDGLAMSLGVRGLGIAASIVAGLVIWRLLDRPLDRGLRGASSWFARVRTSPV